MGATDFVIDRTDLRRCRFATAPELDDIELERDSTLLRVTKFGFTANNVTYAVVGDMMSYWSFFPAEPGWGRVPVWGFARAGAKVTVRFAGQTKTATAGEFEPKICESSRSPFSANCGK